MTGTYNNWAMTKTQFYKELQNIGVDTSDPAQMKVWSLALLAMGQDYIDHKEDRCQDCYYSDKAMVNGKPSSNACPNEFCPVKHLPSTPGAVVDYMFKQNFPLDLSAFFNEYVDPILTNLSEQEEKQQNARQRNSGNH